MAPLQSVLTPAACGGLPTVEREEITQQRLALSRSRVGWAIEAARRVDRGRNGRGEAVRAARG